MGRKTWRQVFIGIGSVWQEEEEARYSIRSIRTYFQERKPAAEADTKINRN